MVRMLSVSSEKLCALNVNYLFSSRILVPIYIHSSTQEWVCSFECEHNGNVFPNQMQEHQPLGAIGNYNMNKPY